MPTYEYACRSCGERLEVVQSFSDDPLTECPACSGELRKVFSPVGIAFKGGGFYKTDSRSSSKKSSSTTSTSTDSSTTTKSDSAGASSTSSGSTSTGASKSSEAKSA